MTDAAKREAVFISHANPESNAFARWLGAKLAAMGYEVWADVMKLHGGSNWARDLEEALRQRAIKMLLVCTPVALDKDGVRNEIQIASTLAKDLKDREFIIPLRLEKYEPPFLIAQAQYVDFQHSWAAGFAELVELLGNVYRIPRGAGRSMDSWLTAQSAGATRLTAKPEMLMSNWLKLQTLPASMRYCEPRGGVSIDRFQDRSLHRWPVVPFRAGVLTFAEPDARGLLSANLPARVVGTMRTDSLLRQGWKRLGVTPRDGKNFLADLGNQAFEAFAGARGLSSYLDAHGRPAWWGRIGKAPLGQVAFNWPQHKGRRLIVGQSGKRRVHWHYAIAGQVRTSPIRHVRLSGRLIFTENGLDALDDPKRMHRLRRSFAKSWRNARWRDMLSAFLWWIADGQRELSLPVSPQQGIVLALPTMEFVSPVRAIHVEEEDLEDDDDPDVDVDESDDEEEEDG